MYSCPIAWVAMFGRGLKLIVTSSAAKSASGIEPWILYLSYTRNRPVVPKAVLMGTILFPTLTLFLLLLLLVLYCTIPMFTYYCTIYYCTIYCLLWLLLLLVCMCVFTNYYLYCTIYCTIPFMEIGVVTCELSTIKTTWEWSNYLTIDGIANDVNCQWFYKPLHALVDCDMVVVCANTVN
jgi:hypothetical protein